MSGITHGAKVTPISYIFGEERKTLPILDMEAEDLSSILSTAKAKLVKDIIEKQKTLKKEKGIHQDAYILFMGHVYVVRSANAKCDKLNGEKARDLKKVLSS